MQISNRETATVFNLTEAENRKNTIKANLSTYEGKDREDKAVYSSWRTYFVGKAYEKAKTELKEKDKILLTNAKVENDYNKEQDKLYVSITVFDFEIAN